MNLKNFDAKKAKNLLINTVTIVGGIGIHILLKRFTKALTFDLNLPSKVAASVAVYFLSEALTGEIAHIATKQLEILVDSYNNLVAELKKAQTTIKES